jgi:hypothetical protein
MMKTLALSACLAVTVMVAVELKDPAAVAADWDKTIAEAHEPVLASGTLGSTATGVPAVNLLPPENTPGKGLRFKNDVREIPPGWQIDPKILHGAPNATPPPGAKPWYYRGQKYWLIPIDTPIVPAK